MICMVFWDIRDILLFDVLTRGETVMLRVTAKYCSNCDGPLRTSGEGCLVPVLSWCRIKFGHTWHGGQHISCRSSGGRFLIIHPIAQIPRPVIFIFSYTSRNSGPVIVSVLKMTERRRCASHRSSNPRQQISTTKYYESWSRGMTNVSIPEVNM